MKKRFVSLIMILAMVSSFTIGVVALNEEIFNYTTEIAVISDLHIVADSYFTNQQTFDDYVDDYLDRGRLVYMSESIAKSMVDDIISKKKIKTVLVPGDLTESGDPTSHQAAAKIFKKLTDNGKQVFVINGNHDDLKRPNQTNKITAQEFREIYEDCGYSKAIKKDDKSLSYVADIDKKTRLIAIDNDNYYNTDMEDYKEEIDDRLLDWVIEQLEQCKRDGKRPIAIAHKPLVNHLDFVGKVVGKVQTNDSFSLLAAVLADNGCQYIFTGHLHGQDIAYFTSPDGNRLLDIETSASVYYPSAYRFVSFADNKVTITSKQLDSINIDYISEYFLASDSSIITQDFTAYCYKYFSDSLNKNIEDAIKGNKIIDMLGLSLSEEYEDTCMLILDDIICPLLEMPLYGKSNSINKILTDNGCNDLPQSDHSSLTDLAAFFVATVNSGDENISMDAAELEILKKGVMVLFYFVNENKAEISELLPQAPALDIDVERLFEKGELEMIDSNIFAFVYYFLEDMLPSFIPSLNTSHLKFFKSTIFEGILNGFVDGLGEEVVKYVEEKYIQIESLIEDVLYGFILIDLLQDSYPGDNNIVIDTKTLEPTHN